MRKRGLGRGLDELIGTTQMTQSRVVIDVPIDQVAPNPNQPRAIFDADRLEELTLSIETHGVIQPIAVRKIGDSYEIIAGERRWRAAQRAGLATVPCLVQDVDDEHSLELALIENLQREDLSAVEAARGYRRLISEYSMTQEKLAQMIGKSRSAIANTMRLLDLPPIILDSLANGQISEGHGRALLGLSGLNDAMLSAWNDIRDNNLSVRDTETLVRQLADAADAPVTTVMGNTSSEIQRLDPNLREVQEQIQQALATRVNLKQNARGAGKIEIVFSNGEELDRLVELLLLVGE